MHKKGSALLQDALFNKGTAFSASERERLALRGLLPPLRQTIENQSPREKKQVFSSKHQGKGFILFVSV